MQEILKEKEKHNDKIEELIYYNNYLYLVQTSSNSSLRLLKLDIFGNIIKEVNLNLQYGYTNLQLKLINDKLYLAYSMYDYETMDYVNVIQEINQNIELNIVFRKYNLGHHMIDFIIEGDYKNVRKSFYNGIYLSIVIGFVITILGLFVYKDLLIFLEVDKIYIEKAEQYYFIILLSFIFKFYTF